MTKRRKGGEPLPEKNEDEQALSESALNKLVGAAEVFDLEVKNFLSISISIVYFRLFSLMSLVINLLCLVYL